MIDSYAYIYNLYELNFRCENMFHNLDIMIRY